MFDVLILDAETRQSLVAVRSFGKKGLRVAALANMHKNAPAFFSKWCQRTLASPAPEGSVAYKDYLLHFLKQHKVSVVISSSDGTVELLRRYRHELSQHTMLALASETAMEIAVNKQKTLAIAQQIGIPIPQSIEVSKKSEISKALRKVGLPVIIKPIESWTQTDKGSKRVAPMLARTLEEVHRFFSEVTEYGGSTLFQEYLTGRRESLGIIYKNNKVYAKFCQWAKRTLPPIGGSSVIRESIPVPSDIGRYAEKLIRTINFEGYAEVEFRRDVKGRAYLMEINPRLSASIELGVHAGVDFPMLLYKCTKNQLDDQVKKYTTGIWERYLLGDLISCLESFEESRAIVQKLKIVGDFFLTFLKPMYYDYVDFYDMSPAWNATSDLFARNFKKMFLK